MSLRQRWGGRLLPKSAESRVLAVAARAAGGHELRAGLRGAESSREAKPRLVAMAARRVPRAPIPVAFALAVLATAAPEQAAAQAVTTFISNTGQTSAFNSTLIRATAFTTGTGTYTLSSVAIYLGTRPGSPTPLVQIYGDTGGNPGTLVATMTNPGTIVNSAINSFTAPANITLSASTTYWVVTSNSARTNGRGWRVTATSSSTLDSGTATGWSLGNARFKNDNADTSWTTSTFRIRFQIRGTEHTPTNAAPTVANAIPDQTATAGTGFSYQFPTNTFNDTDTGQTLSYTATKADGATLPTWLGFTPGTRTFAGTPAAADVGTVSVKVNASDGNGGTVSDDFDITVTAPPPTLISNTGQTSAFNSTLIRATAFTTGTGIYTLYSVEIYLGVQPGSPTPLVQIYGDTGGNPGTLVATMTNPGTIVNSAINRFTAPANITLSASTTYWVVTSNSARTNGRGWRVTATSSSTLDSGTATGWSLGNARFKNDNADTSWTTSTFRIRFQIRGTEEANPNAAPTVTNAIPDQTATAGTGFSYQFPTNTFNDTDTGQTLSYTATKADGATLPTWLGFTPGTRTFAGTPATADTGTVSVKVTASDGNGGTVSDDFDITVTDPFTTFISNTGQTSAFNSTLIRATAFTTGTGTYTLSSVAIYLGTRPGSPTPLVQIYGDTGGNPGTLVATMTNPGTIVNSAINSFTAPANITLSASTTYWVVTSNSARTNGRGWRVTATSSSTLDSGTATGWSLGNARFKNDNADTSWTTSTFRIRFQIRGTEHTPTNAAPTVANAIPDQTATAGTGFSYQFPTNTFNDTDTGQTLSYTATKADGATLPTWLGFTPGTRTFAGTPAAADVGTVSVKVNASDGNGGTVSDDFDITVTDPFTTFISNTGQGTNIASRLSRATAFTTGTGTYTLSSVAIRLRTHTDTPTPLVQIYRDASGRPGTLFATMTNPAAVVDDALNIYTAPANTTLAASTTYWLATSNSATALGTGLWVTTHTNTNLDSGAAVGWSIGNALVKTDIRSPSWSTSSPTRRHRFQVRGTVQTPPPNAAPTVANAIPDQTATAGTAFTYQFPTNTFNDTDTGDTLSYAATKDDGSTLPTWLAFTDSTRTFAGTPATADTGTVSVKVTASDDNGGTVSDDFNIMVAADTTPPTLTSADVHTSGLYVRLEFSENLQTANLPAASAFTVTADGSAVTVTGVTQGGGLDRFFVTVTPARIRQGQAVVVTYTDPTTGDDGLAAQDVAGNDVASFTTGMNSVVDVTNLSEQAADAPGAPTSLSATASGATTINLIWKAPASDGGAAITGYKIEVSPDGTSNWTDRVANTNSADTTYEHTGLAGGTTRHYRVSAINSVGTSTTSNVDSATTNTANTAPGAPTGLTATASGSTTINLSWTAPASTGGSAITGYKIEVSPDGTSNWTGRVANTNSADTTYEHTGLAGGTTRHYRVSAINSVGTSTPSDVANATTNTANTAPGAPTGLTATASGTTRINLSWTAPASTGGSAITGYKIEVSPNGTSNWTGLVANTNSTDTTYEHTGLAGGPLPRLGHQLGRHDTPSDVANATTNTANTAPGAPTGLTATASGTTRINLSWTAPASTGGSAITGYKIEVSPNGTSNWTGLVANTNSTDTTYEHTGLAGGTTHHYRVSAINSVGTSTPSNVASATTDTVTDTRAPVLTGATVNGGTLVLTYDETLDGASVPAAGAFAVTAAGSAVTVNGVSVGGSAVTLTLANAVQANQTVTLDYTPGASPIQDGAGNDAAALTGRSVTNNTPRVSIGPWLLSVSEDVGDAVLTVSLDRPAASAVSVAWQTQDDTAESPNDFTAQEDTVTFAVGDTRKNISVPILDDAVREDPVHDVHEIFFVILRPGPGYSLSNVLTADSSVALVEIVDNDGDGAQDVTPPMLTHATVNGTTLVLTYDEALEGASVPAAGAFAVTAAGSAVGVNLLSVGGSAVTLTLASAVQANQTVTLDYTPGRNPIRDAAGNNAAALSGRSVTNNTPNQPTDTRAPLLTDATVTASTLVLAYDETLDGGSVPAAGDFAVTAAGSAVTVNGVSAGGSAVTLTLANAVQAGQTVTLDHTPGANPIQDAAGNDAAALSGQAVTNNTTGGPVIDTRAPVLTGATVTASTLVLAYDETLDGGSVAGGGRLRRDGGGKHHQCERGQRGRVGGDADAGQCRAGEPGGDAGLHAGGEPDPGRGRQRRRGPLWTGGDQQHDGRPGDRHQGAGAHRSYGERHRAGADLRRDARRWIGPGGGRLRRDGGGQHRQRERGERGRFGGNADAGQCGAGQPDGNARLHARREPDPGRGGQQRGGALRTQRDQQHPRSRAEATRVHRARVPERCRGCRQRHIDGFPRPARRVRPVGCLVHPGPYRGVAGRLHRQ